MWPGFPQEWHIGLPSIVLLFGRSYRWSVGGRSLRRRVMTPPWCPYIRDPTPNLWQYPTSALPALIFGQSGQTFRDFLLNELLDIPFTGRGWGRENTVKWERSPDDQSSLTVSLETTKQLLGIQPIYLGKDLLHQGRLHILEDKLNLSLFSHCGIYLQTKVTM